MEIVEEREKEVVDVGEIEGGRRRDSGRE